METTSVACHFFILVRLLQWWDPTSKEASPRAGPLPPPASRRAPSTPLWPRPRAGPPAGFPRLLPRVFRDLPSQPLHHWVPPTQALSSQAQARWRCTHCPSMLPRSVCGYPALSQLLGPGVKEVLSCPESLLLSLSPQGAGGPQGGVRGARLSSPWVPPQNTRGCNLSRAPEGCSRGSCFAPWTPFAFKMSFLGSFSWALLEQKRCRRLWALGRVGLRLLSAGLGGGRAPLDYITEGLRVGGSGCPTAGDAGRGFRSAQWSLAASTLLSIPRTPALGGPVPGSGGFVHLEPCSLQRGGGGTITAGGRGRQKSEGPGLLPNSLAGSACRPVHTRPAARQPPPVPLFVPIPA